MSGLENFKSDNSWRTNFKNLLFMQRTPVHKVVDPLRAANRFSLDIVDDLEDLVTKKKALIDKEMMNSIENKETRTCCSGDAEHITQYKDSTTYNNMLQNSVKSVELCSLDDSFEALEKMCNKTASDPNSTLFKYLQSDNKSDILTDFKRKTIYNDLKKNEHNSQVDVDIPVKEVTQLEDIEAPSLLWENSIVNEIHQPTSPIKMVGLLRPSTILEENTEGNSENESGLTSYYTAFKSSDSKSFRNFESEIDVTDTIMSSGLGNPEGYLKLDCEKTFESVKSDDTTHTTGKKQQIEGMSESDSSDSVIEVLSDNEEGNEYFNTMNFIHHSNIIDGENQLQFNDTLEEVEYMLKKRLDYIKSTPVKCNENSSVELTKNSIKEMHKSISSKTPNKEMHITSRHDNSLFGFDIKPFPKLSVFKHPAAKSGIPSNRNQFAHVVSPIGVYMKNTAITPLISTMKCNNKQHISNTSAFKDVEFESRLQKTPLKTIESSALYSNSDDIPTGSKILPKKAYISCNLKQITDERTRLKIPGGKKIQKYLEPAMLPAVVRHDGKAKNHGHQNTKTESYESNNSLVNLSVASGDVSLYTIVDARKF